MSINVELENLYYADKEEREANVPSSTLEEHSKQRLLKLKELLPKVDTEELWNCHYIAYLLHHGETTEDYILAHRYAKKAIDMGSNVTKWLYAATLDRWLVSKGKLQKYGTQFKQVYGRWQQLPVDKTITDDERVQYGVPPLNEALQKFKEKIYSRTSLWEKNIPSE